jgi:uncharacterized RDD family membrane protein YckC
MNLLETPMLPESRSFFVRGDDGEEYGPVDLQELREWVRENRAGIGTEVRRDEPMATWNDWQTYPELIALLAEVHVTSPVPGLPALVIAPIGRRVVAFGLDLFLIMLLYTPIFITVVLIFMPDFCVRYVNYVITASQTPFAPFDIPMNEQVIFNMIFNLILALYVTGFHIAHGQTPAKALLRVRVVDQLGQKPGPIRSFLRALILIFSMNLFFLPLIYAFFNPQRRTLHDYVAGTYVVEA